LEYIDRYANVCPSTHLGDKKHLYLKGELEKLYTTNFGPPYPCLYNFTDNFLQKWSYLKITPYIVGASLAHRSLNLMEEKFKISRNLFEINPKFSQ